MFPTQALSAILVTLFFATTTHASLFTDLFPTTHDYTTGFTTADVDVSKHVEKVPMTESALNIPRAPATIQKAGKTVWQANYPKHALGIRGGSGFNIRINGTDPFYAAARNGEKEFVIGYSVMFDEGFTWRRGGKLPGGCAYTAPCFLPCLSLTRFLSL